MSETQRYTNMSRAELIEELAAADERVLELESFLEGAIELLPNEGDSETDSEDDYDGPN
jgi:hypothetical protein